MDDACLASSLGPVAAHTVFCSRYADSHANGLIPIEKVRMGDWLLSQPDAKDGSPLQASHQYVCVRGKKALPPALQAKRRVDREIRRYPTIQFI